MATKLLLLISVALFYLTNVNFGQAVNASTSFAGEVSNKEIASLIAGDTNQAVTITPNPFSATAAVIINNDMQLENCELRIYNVLGSEVMNTPITKQITILETGNLPSGIYFYKMIDNNIIIQSGRLIARQ